MFRRQFLSLIPMAAAMPFAAKAASHAAPAQVAIKSFAYEPEVIEIKAGESVEWTNMDRARHSATADNGGFDTGLFRRNESRTVQFNQKGTFTYFCTAHRRMKGTVVVV